MLPSLSSFPAISTLFAFTFSLIFSVSFSPSVFAQKFRPVAFSGECHTFIEGQGLYFVGTAWEDDTISQSFMLDLSVSWNTSDPVYKKLPSPNEVLIDSCEMTSDGEHLFVWENDVGFVYNLKSDTWTEFNDKDLVGYGYAEADPETGFIYLPFAGLDSKEKDSMLSLDLRTKMVNKTVLPADIHGYYAAWSEYLRSMVVFDDQELALFTPSKVNKSSTGWSKQKIPLIPEHRSAACLVPANGGTKLVLSVYTIPFSSYRFTIFTLDLITRTWRKGPRAPSIIPSACAVTGDQLILWGGLLDDPEQGNRSTAVFVYNMKTEKWTTTYTAPPSQSTMTASLSPTQHIPYSTITPDHSEVSPSKMKLITIVTIVTGSLLVIILTGINVYLGIWKRSKVDTHRTIDGSSDTAMSTLLPKKHPVRSSCPCDT